MNDPIIIRDFCTEDLEKAGDIALQIWGDETGLIPNSMKKDLYSFLVRYYYVPDSPLSCCAQINGKLCGFLLAAKGKHEKNAAEQWITPRLSAPEKDLFHLYKAYLDGNGTAEHRLVRENEALLLFFASLKKGCGSRLMEEFRSRCRKHAIRSILLWTDDTCDFDWYRRNDFTEVTRFSPVPSFPGKDLTTLIFRKEIDH